MVARNSPATHNVVDHQSPPPVHPQLIENFRSYVAQQLHSLHVDVTAVRFDFRIVQDDNAVQYICGVEYADSRIEFTMLIRDGRHEFFQVGDLVENHEGDPEIAQQN